MGLIVFVIIALLVDWSNGQLCRILAKFAQDRIETLDTVIDCNTREFGLNNVDYKSYESYDQLWWNGMQASSGLYRLGLDAALDPDRISILKFLNISEFHVNVLQANTFHNLPEVRTLHLEQNRLNAIAWDVFNELHNLKMLTMRDNGLNGISWRTFEGLGRLEVLTVVENKVKRLHVNLKGLPKLRELRIKGVRIISQQTIESIFGTQNDTRSLKTIELADSNIEKNFTLKLDYKDVNLKNLSIVNCNLTAVRAYLPNLEHLNLSRNFIRSEIYLELYDMHSLRVLDLSGNLLRSLRGQFCESCRKLEKVYLNDNRIHFVAFDALSHHKRLELVDFTQNKLVMMQPGVQRFLDHVSTIISDDNPWDCRWLEETLWFPDELFEKLRFHHVSDQINVKGLGCVVYADLTTTTEIVAPFITEHPVKEPENTNQGWMHSISFTVFLIALSCIIFSMVVWPNREWFLTFCSKIS